MTSIPALLAIGWLLAALLMGGLYLIQFLTRNATLVDVGWAASIGFLSVFYGWMAGESIGAWIAAGMGALWAVRLTLYLYFDRMRGKPEDGRYRNLREKWGKRAQPAFFLFFQAQAFLAVLFSVPILLSILHIEETGLPWVLLGLAVWALAVVGESIADFQLHRFKQNPGNHGKTCRAGLWSASRHPNYFFEWLHWWSYVLLTVGSWTAWVNLLFPFIMLFFLFKVTGIPATEEQALRTKGEDYRDYQRTTSVFVLWFPKHRARP